MGLKIRRMAPIYLSALLATMLAVTLMLVALSAFPRLVRPQSGEPHALAILRACRSWYVILAVTAAAGFLLVLAVSLFLCLRSFQQGDAPLHLVIFMCAVLLVLTGFIGLGMLAIEQVPQLYQQAGADIAQLETGTLEEATVWVSPKTRQAHVPGPYSSSRDSDGLTRLGIIGGVVGNRWENVYVPDAMGFTLDQEHLFNENYSIDWNEEHARQYHVTYTSAFHLVVDIVPLAMPH